MIQEIDRDTIVSQECAKYNVRYGNLSRDAIQSTETQSFLNAKLTLLLPMKKKGRL